MEEDTKYLSGMSLSGKKIMLIYRTMANPAPVGPMFGLSGAMSGAGRNKTRSQKRNNRKTKSKSKSKSKSDTCRSAG